MHARKSTRGQHSSRGNFHASIIPFLAPRPPNPPFFFSLSRTPLCPACFANENMLDRASGRSQSLIVRSVILENFSTLVNFRFPQIVFFPNVTIRPRFFFISKFFPKQNRLAVRIDRFSWNLYIATAAVDVQYTVERRYAF